MQYHVDHGHETCHAARHLPSARFSASHRTWLSSFSTRTTSTVLKSVEQSNIWGDCFSSRQDPTAIEQGQRERISSLTPSLSPSSTALHTTLQSKYIVGSTVHCPNPISPDKLRQLRHLEDSDQSWSCSAGVGGSSLLHEDDVSTSRQVSAVSFCPFPFLFLKSSSYVANAWVYH